MNAGKENESKRSQNELSTNSSRNKVGDATKIVAKSIKRPSTEMAARQSEVNGAIKMRSTTTASTTKITKLVLKPKPTTPSKSSLTSKVTTKKYTTKPVTIKSRSTMISHESTFRIRNMKKSPTNKKPTDEQNEALLLKNEQISQQFVINGSTLKCNEMIEPFEIVQKNVKSSVSNVNVTSLNVSKSVKSPILQEITQAVVNSSNLVESPKKHCESDAKCMAKSYDPIKARQFIRMQKEQRKKMEKEQKKDAPPTKEEIKQRLSALRKNTLKIVEKNLQKARNTRIKESKTFTTKNRNVKTISHQQKDSKSEVIKETPIDLKTPLSRLQPKVSPTLALTPSKFLPSIKTDKNRIGILRRTEAISPTIETGTIEPQILDVGCANVEHNSVPNINVSLEKSIQNSSFNRGQSNCDFELKPPETVPLKSSLLHEIDHSHQQNNEDAVKKSKEIPFWLRPTPVQPYPYNFIVAVRKKLESITNPVYQSQPQQWPDPCQETSFHSPMAQSNAIFASNYRHNIHKIQSESEKSMTEQIQSSDLANQEEYSMDFSSVTYESKKNQCNSLSKSERKSVGVSQDTLSISSGILSSPEKKVRTTKSDGFRENEEKRPPSPLTTDNVDGLHITSNSFTQNVSSASSVVSHHSVASSVASHINFGRGKDYNSRSIPSLRKLSQQHSVEELLDDFKSSLSAAIEANQRLHEMLSNPPSSRLTQYSDDFEQTSDNQYISEQIAHESNTIPSYSSSRIASLSYNNGSKAEDKNKSVIANQSNTSTTTKVVEYDNNVSDMIFSKQSQIESTSSNDIVENQEGESTLEREKNLRREESLQREENRQDEGSLQEVESLKREESLQSDEISPRRSSTLIEEKIDDYHSSDSPTNNDLKSISLSIAKKSAPTSDDTEPPSNAIESFSKQIVGDADVANESVGSNIFNVFKKNGLNIEDDINKSNWSDHNISYSTLGMCDQLLKTEMQKSEDLASLLKIREKSLVNRFKGQIAWLELQKQKFKESGLTAEISMIKKKQRALLLRLNNDRKELHRILKERQQMDSMRNPSMVNYNISQMSTTNMSIRRTSISNQYNGTSTAERAVKAIELPGGGATLETMLQKRENELCRRREYVEKLLGWHQRLNDEENEVIKMEQMIMFISSSDVYCTTSREQINDTLAITVQHHHRHHHHHQTKRTNCQRKSDNSENSSVYEHSITNANDSITMEKTHFNHKKQKQIQKIEKSLNTLKMISSQSILTSDIDGSSVVDDVVDIFGRQLNKLWKRLTGVYEKKYVPDKVYTLTKSDLELLYEEAKMVVLKQFHKKDEFKRRFIDNSMSIIDENQRNSISISQLSEINDDAIIAKKTEQENIVPTLNLASSPEQRENLISDTDQGYYFSNSNNEQISEQKNRSKIKTKSQSVEKSDDTIENIEINEFQTEQSIEEKNEQSENLQEEIQSDITEDSLNKSNILADETVSPSEIETISLVNESRPTESEIQSKILSAIETNQSSVTFELQLSDNNDTQLIEETSFPNIDIQTTVSSVIESDISAISQSSVSPVKKSLSNISTRPSDDHQKYQTDDFEDGKSSDELTSISTATVTVVATTTTTTPTESQSTEKITTSKIESPKELEQRLILIDEGLKELNETISHSPILRTETENTNDIKSTAKTTDINSALSDNEVKAENESESIESVEKSEEITQSNEEKTVYSEKITQSTGNETSVSDSNDKTKIDSDESTDSIAAEIAASKADPQASVESLLQKRPYQFTLSTGSIDYNKVPEADALKRSQISPDIEVKAPEQPMFPFLREIPNKPPPPYPVHRQLPKTPTFPSHERVEEIVYRRVEELYEKLNASQSLETSIRNDATFIKSPTLSISSPDSPVIQSDTNVFERIILDSCDEIMYEISAPEKQSTAIFRQPLEFFNPPNRLHCFQRHTLKRIFKLLNRPCPDDESKSYTGMCSFLPSQVSQLTFNNRRKRDAVDDILIQELYEDEARWTNFDLEEQEIRDNVSDLRTLLTDESSSFLNATNTE